MPSSAESRPTLRWIEWGRKPYREALDAQLERWEAVAEGRASDAIFTVEHDPVITLGKRARQEDILLSEDALRMRGIDLVEVDRGGEATWHGPGQLVIYPIIHLQRHEIGVSDLVRGLAASIAEELASYGIAAIYEGSRPGLWVGEDKICAVGMRIQRHVSRHGAALNITTAEDAFSVIVPCGIREGGVTSVAQQLAEPPSRDELATGIITRFAERFGFSLERGRPARID